MRNRILLGVTVLLALILVVVSSKYQTTFFIVNSSKDNDQRVAVKDTSTNTINDLELEEYVIGVVAAEMPASFHEEALKAQAVAARTYAMYKIGTSKENFHVTNDITSQSYIDEEEMHKKWGSDYLTYYEKIKKAVNDTKGEVLKYQDEIIAAYYFAMSNGYTEEADLVFNENKDYLVSVKSSYDNASLKNYEVITTFSKTDFCQKLNLSCTKIVINNIERSATNRVNNITINNMEFKGTLVRSKLGLRSTDFDIKINNNEVMITTRGYGHGVGMSQYGANGMAKDGYNYKEILTYFYKNVTLANI